VNSLTMLTKGSRSLKLFLTGQFPVIAPHTVTNFVSMRPAAWKGVPQQTRFQSLLDAIPSHRSPDQSRSWLATAGLHRIRVLVVNFEEDHDGNGLEIGRKLFRGL
jgi:hypothetical protein